MNYNQLSFWIFFFTVLIAYWRLPHRKQNTLMLVASYVFYGFWDYRFLFLILISTVIDFIGGLGVAGIELPAGRLRRLFLILVGGAIVLCTNVDYPALFEAVKSGDGGAALHALPSRLADFYVPLGTAVACAGYGLYLPRLYALPEPRRRVVFLAISMVANLAILAFFKYCDFFITSFVDLAHALGARDVNVSVLGIVLPAGISFYTFQAMSYTVDIYRKETEPTTHLGDFALFVCFFPHLVAGPIMRAHTLLPQVLRPRKLARGAFEEGLVLVLIGLFKKMVIADNMAPIANAVFYRFQDGDAAGMTGGEALVGLYAFAFQIYGDFSGYSSIARGISKWLGFELVINFHNPYVALSPSDFWRRWHISLSSWLRDYLYIPLGGNRGGKLMEYRNLMLTMLLGGLWHGASWTFVAWGFYHGAILCIFRLLRIKDPKPSDRLRWLVRVVVMFHLTCLGWLLFRADSFRTVLEMSVLIATDPRFTPAALAAAGLIGFHCAALFVVELFTDGENALDRLVRAPWPLQGAFYSYLVAMIFLFGAEQAIAFIYFQF
ncbi:MAG: MBOAT family protein [Labilithrix sp.]|nr:MBOAT family protein [Labilithrix sp.]MBX3203383.1 MBOAT family protein [Labilithrix sp.]